jgi:predicted ATPase/DNA-binding winged helix-turn-helix (wHTH) protein
VPPRQEEPSEQPESAPGVRADLPGVTPNGSICEPHRDAAKIRCSRFGERRHSPAAPWRLPGGRLLRTFGIDISNLAAEAPVNSEAFAFGSFRLIPAERVLLREGNPLRLGSRAFDILVALVEHAGMTVLRDELIARAWPDTVVEESSLRVQIAALRKALGDGRSGNRFITSVSGRGYVFVAPATVERNEQLPDLSGRALHGNVIPALLTRIIGRDNVVATLAAQLGRRRLLTIVGPGGIGKTTVAAAIAETARASFPDGVWFIELASLVSPDLVPSALGTVLQISLPGTSPVSGLIAWLRDKHALIILDNCEHVVSEVATLAKSIMISAPNIRILATSREPLEAEGEWVHRLAPLEFPKGSGHLAAGEALQYPAVQLFNERALAAADQWSIDDGSVPAVVEICRRLDGVPLALELAAAQVGALGIQGLAARLHLALRIKGRRTGSPRHQTLQATLDWSWGLLPEAERGILRRLGAFQGDFTMDAAGKVAADEGGAPEHVVDAVANLVDRSLVAADISGDVTYYHLLEITRIYALERLQESGERDWVTRCHAQYYLELFARAEAGAAARSKVEWLADYGRHIGNLRAALDWAFSPHGDVALGVALAAATTDFWIAISLLNECCEWGLKAVAQLGAAKGTRDEMILQCGLGQALTYSRGMQQDARAAFTRALTLSEALADADCQLRAIYGLWLFALRVGDFQECLAQARKCELLGEASSNHLASATADFTLGLTRYYMGEHAAAAALFQRAAATYPIATRSGDPIRFGVDLLTLSLCYQALTFWSLGFADKAYRAGREAMKEARSVNQPVTLCWALAASSCHLLVGMGYLEEAERCIEELIDHSEKYSLIPYHELGLCAKGGLLAAQGDISQAERLLRSGLQQCADVAYYLFYAFFRGELAAVLGSAGRIDEGLVEIDAALGSAGDSECLWHIPEIMRVKGELLANRPRAAGDVAEEWLVRSRDLAGRQGALSWELRAAMSLARFWRDRNRTTEAHELLDGVYGRFTEGFDTADLRAAKALLTELSG